MTNLLPQAQQQQIIKEYKHRRMIVVLLMIVVTILVCATFLLPSYILSEVKFTEMQNSVEMARNSSEELLKTKNSATVILKDADRKIKLLQPGPVGEQSVFSIIDLITQNKIPEIKIQSMLYTAATEKESGNVLLTGIAKDRDSLTAFLKNLEAQSVFETVDLPVSNFAKDKDINFSMQLYGAF